MGTAARMERERVDPAMFREHLINTILIVGTFGIVTFMCCAFTITYQIIIARVAVMQSLTDLQRGTFSRADAAFWRVDTFLTEFKATNKSLANGLNNVRVQVKQSQDAQTQQTKEISRVATKVATESLKATQNVVEAVADKPAPIVEVKTPAATFEVKTPPPVIERRKEEPKPDPPPADPQPKKRWYRRFWPFG